MKDSHLQPERFDLSQSDTFSAFNRTNLVTVENMAHPETESPPEWSHPEFSEIVQAVVEARNNDNPVIWSMGAHVIKNGLSRYIIELLKEDIITHIAGNGAVSIHDFELAYLGGTSEYVPDAIKDGSFGLWKETGAWMNKAIKNGAEEDLGYGASLAHYMENNKGKFPYLQDCVVYQAYKYGVPATYHVTIGTDIIHEHPQADFESIGKTSGIDFSIYCKSISQLEGGVFLNFGSAVTGPEVFLKALAVVRNQGFKTENITTANFDIIPLGKNYRNKISKDHFHYYYRPRKNIVNRPTASGGKGFYIKGNHKKTIPNLYSQIQKKIK